MSLVNNHIYSIAIARDVPADGTCLFHAMSLPFNLNGTELRSFIAKYIEKNASTKELHGQLIETWIEWDKNIKKDDYTNSLENGLWGGALEITLFSSFIGKPIFVYEPTENKNCSLITETYPDTNLQLFKTNIEYIALLYVNKSHYMNLHFQ